MLDMQKEVAWLRDTYFSDPAKQVSLRKGEKLLTPGQRNDRLYLVLEGVLVGFIEDPESDERFEIFRSGPGNFVGAYSFFSSTHRSYSTVYAEEPARLAYVLHEEAPPGSGFASRLTPIIVEEIYLRQLQAQRMSLERQRAIRRLMQSEKLATLGQLAAGLAHELNNAIGVIQKNTEWLSTRIVEYVAEKEAEDLRAIFEKGLRDGQCLSTTELRKRRRAIEEKFGFLPALAKTLAKIGASDEMITRYGERLEQDIERVNYFFETGLVLHDMLLAAKHAGQVVRSVRELGMTTRAQPIEMNIDNTIREAISLTQEMLKKVDFSFEPHEALPHVFANPGDWVQVWINLIKNACEAVAGAGTPRPKVKISTGIANHRIRVEVSDNGPGIPIEAREKIFQPSYTTKVHGLTFGLGLGLSIVQRIINSYGGAIQVNSRPGHTVFIVEIPAMTSYVKL
jgi:signal transduction histidine kinase